MPGGDDDDDEDDDDEEPEAEEEKKEEVAVTNMMFNLKALIAKNFKERKYRSVKGDAVDKVVE